MFEYRYSNTKPKMALHNESLYTSSTTLTFFTDIIKKCLKMRKKVQRQNLNLVALLYPINVIDYVEVTVYIVYREPWYVSHILHRSLHNNFFSEKDVITPPLILRNFSYPRRGY